MIGWTREGDSVHANSGLATLISDEWEGQSGWMLERITQGSMVRYYG